MRPNKKPPEGVSQFKSHELGSGCHQCPPSASSYFGGGRGTGLEPSPRRPGWGKVSQRTPRLQPTCQGLAKTADARKGRRRALYGAKAPATVNFRRGLSSDGIFAFVASLGACPPQTR